MKSFSVKAKSMLCLLIHINKAFSWFCVKKCFLVFKENMNSKHKTLI